jgi:ABC-type sugar transport system ATPase subunit
MTDINKSFPGVQALTDVELCLEKGEVLGVIGENGAGKSTLMNVLSGVFAPDSGQILVRDKEVDFRSPHDALSAGISMIHQEIQLVPELTVAENVWLGREGDFTRLRVLNKRDMFRATDDLMHRFGISLDPKLVASSLSAANMQLVEILRAVSYRSEIIIMDEPTSSLTDHEVEILFELVRTLQKGGVSFIFISHKIDELLEICDRISVMRDSRYVGTVRAKETSSAELVRMMVGQELQSFYQKEATEVGDVVLAVKDLTREGVFFDISLELHRGEVLGIAGLVGAGRSEFAQALFGIDPKTGGHIYLDGQEVSIDSPADAIRNGIAMVTEDRAQSGLVLGMSAFHNITLSILQQLSKAGIMRKALEKTICRRMIREQKIKVSGERQLAGQLSGGNQQKVVLSKCLLTEPRILILDEPTRGIDVGSKSEIYHQMSELTRRGVGIIMISSEMPEILAMSDRILVIREGRLVFQCSREEASKRLIMQYAFGQAKETVVDV